MTNDEIERGLLWANLCQWGNYSKLKFQIDHNDMERQLEQFKDNWVPYHSTKGIANRWGLPITNDTGILSDTSGLQSLNVKENSYGAGLTEDQYTVKTPVYHAIPSVAKVVDQFDPDIGRVHFLKIDAGGYFPMHKDFPGPTPEYFRLLVVFGKVKPENYGHILHDQLFYPDPGFMYFVNFQLNHAVFSFTDSVYCMILTVKLNQRTYDIIRNNLMV